VQRSDTRGSALASQHVKKLRNTILRRGRYGAPTQGRSLRAGNEFLPEPALPHPCDRAKRKRAAWVGLKGENSNSNRDVR